MNKEQVAERTLDGLMQQMTQVIQMCKTILQTIEQQQTEPQPVQWLTTKQVCKLTGFSSASFLVWKAQGKINYTGSGRGTRYSSKEIDRFMRERGKECKDRQSTTDEAIEREAVTYCQTHKKKY